MILVRDVFRLKFGKAREAMATWKELGAQARKAQYGALSMSLLTDVVGPYYTLVLESTFDDLAAYERAGQRLLQDEEWRKRYAQFTPLAESGHREIFRVVEL